MNREVKIGIVVVIAVLLLYAGGSYLSGNNVFKEQNDYHVVYDKVEGLLVGNEVRYEGFKVGRVDNISYLAASDQWLVTFSITEESIQMKNKTLAYISSADILGTMIIQLDSLQQGDRLAIPNDTLLGRLKPDIREDIDRRLRPLVLKIEGLIGSVDSVISVVTLLLDEDTRNNIKQSLDKIPQAIQNILHATEVTDTIINQLERSRIQDIVNNMAVITENFKNNSASINKIIRNFEGISDSLSESEIKQTFLTINSVMSRTDSVLAKIEKGEGTIGLLANDEKLYNDLVYAVTSLDHLMMDVRQNPKRFVRFSLFGGGNKKKKPVTRDTAEIRRNSDPYIQRLLREEFNDKLDSLDAIKDAEYKQQLNDSGEDTSKNSPNCCEDLTLESDSCCLELMKERLKQKNQQPSEKGNPNDAPNVGDSKP